tara:strand:- start:5564 stop:5806 length:243 start_codon:yes stop_codon:yes gene_type:complete
MKMLDEIQGFLVNKYTLGGSLLVVGVSTLVTPPMSDVLNRVWASPMGFDITILRFMGVLTFALGVAVLTGEDPLSVKKEV